jgi:hypothetical protein
MPLRPQVPASNVTLLLLPPPPLMLTTTDLVTIRQVTPAHFEPHHRVITGPLLQCKSSRKFHSCTGVT